MTMRADIDNPPAVRHADSGSGGEPPVVSLLRVHRVALTFLATAAGILLLRYMQDVLIPLVLAGLIFYALDPFVDRLARWRLPRALAAAVVLLAVMGMVAGLAYTLSDDVLEVARDLPAAAAKIRERVRESRRDSPSTLERAATAIDKTTEEAAAATPAPSGVVRVQVDEAPFRLADYLRWATPARWPSPAACFSFCYSPTLFS